MHLIMSFISAGFQKDSLIQILNKIFHWSAGECEYKCTKEEYWLKSDLTYIFYDFFVIVCSLLPHVILSYPDLFIGSTNM